MNYLTRGKNITPDNKPKIVIYAAQEDYEQYYQKTAGLLLEKKNCAVIRFSELSDSFNPSELDSMLKQDFVLIVCIVTNRLVDETPDAAELISKANSLQIPVLPILLEQLVHNDRYNELFENRQFLDPTANDETAISFGKKLSDYLNTILADDETIKRIDEEFRDRIFLSYRKANRAFANELFKIIHSDPALTDVGVWYDEYIEGGDDFEADITKALKNSKIFLLCITHKLLSEPNYVTEHEYPNAVALGLPVVSIEMEPSLSEFVQERLYGLDKVIPFFDKEELLTQLKKLITPTERYTAEHCYYVGLAYLNMRYVEYDPSKALSLIQSAMEMGLPEAALTLASMYSNGQGVARSHAKAMSLSKRAAELLKAKLEEDPNDPHYKYLFFATCLTVGNDLQKDGQSTEASRYFKMMSEFDPDDDPREIQLSQSVSLLGESQKYVARQDYRQALSLIDQAIAIRAELIKTIPENSQDYIRYRRALAVAYLKRGDCLEQSKDIFGAKESFLTCLTYREQAYRQLREQSDTYGYEAKRDYAVILTRLANLYSSCLSESPKNIEQILSLYKTSLKIRGDLFTETHSSDHYRDLGVGYCALGEYLLKIGQPDTALRYLSEAERIFQELIEMSETIGDHIKLNRAYEQEILYCKALFETNKTPKRWNELYHAYKTCKQHLIDLRNQIMTTTTNSALTPDTASVLVGIEISLSNILINRAFLCMEYNPSQPVADIFNENLVVCTELYQISSAFGQPPVEASEKYAYALYLCAQYTPLDNAARRQYLETSFEIYQRLAQKFPDNKDYAEMSVAVFTLLHEGV